MFLSNIVKNLKTCCKFVRHSSSVQTATVHTITNDPLEVLSDDSLSYQDIFFTLHEQAKRSLLLHVNTDPGIDQDYLSDHLKKFCSEKGNVLYLTSVKNSPNYFLVEFGDEEGIHNLSLSSVDGTLRLRMTELSPTGLNLSLRNKKTDVKSSNHLYNQLKNASSFSDQIYLYFQEKRASSDQLRNRLFFSSLFEDFINSHMKTSITAMPYGTTWTGYCSPSSDIDISLTPFSFNSGSSAITTLNHLPYSSVQKYKSLYRAGANALFTEAAKLISSHFPGVVNLSSHDASHPLLSFHFSPFALNTEVTYCNRSGIQMAFIINMYTRMDERVAPFLFFLRHWATQYGITKHGGMNYEGITPFMLVCLGLFYLMRISPSVIPPIKDVFEVKNSEDDFILGGFRTKLKRDVRLLRGSNKESVEDLLVGFFDYYRRFNFSDRCLCLRSGLTTPSHMMQLRIKIPVTSDNVGKTCNLHATNDFQSRIETTLRKLEGNRRKRNSNWGMLSIMDLTKNN